MYQHAVRKNRIDIVRLILEFGVNPNPEMAVDFDVKKKEHSYTEGTTPLHVAAKHGRVEIFNLIAQSTQNMNPPDVEKLTPMHWAASKGHLEICQILSQNINASDLNPANIDGSTPLHFAASRGHIEICQILMEHIPDKSPRDKRGQTPLYWTRDYETFKYILERVDDKNPADENGDTPLHRAAEDGQTEICRLILQNVEDKHPKNSCGETPLELAQEWDKDDVVALFKGERFKRY